MYQTRNLEWSKQRLTIWYHVPKLPGIYQKRQIVYFDVNSKIFSLKERKMLLSSWMKTVETLSLHHLTQSPQHTLIAVLLGG